MQNMPLQYNEQTHLQFTFLDKSTQTKCPQISTFRLISVPKRACLIMSNSNTVWQQYRVHQQLGNKIYRSPTYFRTPYKTPKLKTR